MTNPITQSFRLLAIALIAMAMIIAIAPVSRGAAGTKTSKAPKIPSYHGKVTAVDATAGTITITPKKAAAITFTVPTGAAVYVSDAVSSLANVEVGFEAHIKSADGKTALIIKAHPKVAHVKTPKAAAKPATL